jgi:hypothetical protein
VSSQATGTFILVFYCLPCISKDTAHRFGMLAE